ncbi:MAG: insulinase family protein [Bacteroidales bacterium]|nr:insulinase family protein [Bacteroidales bacterium]
MINRKKAPKLDFINQLKTPDIKIHKLNNGVKLYFIKSTNTEISEIIWHYNTGVWEQQKLLVAGMTAKMLSEGSKNYSSSQIADVFDFYGAQFSKEASMHSTSFKLMALNKYLPKLINIVSEILSEPSFDKKEFEVLKKENKQKFLIDLEEIETVARYSLEQNIYGVNHPYGWVAKPEDYDTLDLDSLKSYFEKNYSANNLNIIAVANNENIVIDILKKEFENYHKNIIQTNVNKYKVQSLKQVQYIPKKTSFQSAIRVGWKLFNRQHQDYCDMLIFDTLLGGYFGSRLMQNIRQDLGLTYSIYSSLKALKYEGTFQIVSEVNKENNNRVLDEIFVEINKLKTVYVSDKEMLNLKNYMLGSLLRSIDGNFNFASALSSFLTYNTDFQFYTKFVDRVKNITPDRIKTLANKYFDTKEMFSVIVG